jgi:uncharacterized membrane protein (DUF4010 family)
MSLRAPIPSPGYGLMLPSIWPDLPILQRMALALAIGLFAGLEREHRRKEAGLRTFAFVALIGCVGALLGDTFALLGIGLTGLLIILLNIQTIQAGEGTELTTSAALLLTSLAGVLAGQGQTLAPTVLAVVTAALLAWKQPLHEFSLGLTDSELRSAILLAILAFVIYPVLPPGYIDRWELLDLRAAWIIVILIAGIGFVNYIVLKLYGARGIALVGFSGGLVNSTVTVTELATRDRDSGGQLSGVAYAGILLATVASVLRNVVLLALLAPAALISGTLAFALMLGAGLAPLAARFRSVRSDASTLNQPTLHVSSPFSITSALKYGLLFLALQIAGALGQRALGESGFYIVSILGGVVSSANAVASAALLAAHGIITPRVAAIGAILATAVSALINIPFAARISRDTGLARQLAWSMGILAALGVLGSVVQDGMVAMVARL